MTIFFACLVLCAILQHLVLKNSLRYMESDYYLSVPACEPGEEIELVLVFHNHARLFLPFIRYQTSLPEAFGVDAPDSERRVSKWDGATEVAGTVYLSPRQGLQRHIRITAPGRGRYLLRQLIVFGGDFLGLEEQRQSLSRFRELVVYPKPASLSHLDDVFAAFFGDLSVRRFLFEDPVLTVGCREYTGREPMRSISWTRSAQQGRLMVRQYDHTTDPSVTVVLNVAYVGSHATALIEHCLSLTRSVCEILEKRGITYGFTTNAALAGSLYTDCQIPEGLGPRHLQGILLCLGRATETPRCPPTRLMAALLSDRTRHGIVYVSPSHDDSTRAVLSMVRAAGLAILPIYAVDSLPAP